ncbi:MAG: phosphoribosylformylglycinamidine cyclo-ligase [Candidatus Omnitrophica bacterium]|nr:phosphoribosylformylglycinamidine cyclo-ligase [Candidatus Omnitrophota bacterium]
MTYKRAGVDIDKANALIADYKKCAAFTRTKGVLGNVGSFGGFFRPEFKKFKDPVLVSSTDGVGTKLKIAFLADKHDTVGIDLVAMSVNDILCSGATGMFFLDYIATGKVEPHVLKDVVSGIAAGCCDAGYALVGGETAEMPGIYKEGEYDLAGFGVGIIDRKDIIDGKSIKTGDIVLGLESTGLHSNGYSLVRKVFTEKELKRFSAELLKPTRIYCKSVLAAKKAVRIKGIANITGGAFYDKIPRIIPDGMAIEIYKDSWRVPRIFLLVQEKGNIDCKEMYRTFNMGIGMVLVLGKKDADRTKNILLDSGVKSHVIGKVVKGKREVVIRK